MCSWLCHLQQKKCKTFHMVFGRDCTFNTYNMADCISKQRQFHHCAWLTNCVTLYQSFCVLQKFNYMHFSCFIECTGYVWFSHCNTGCTYILVSVKGLRRCCLALHIPLYCQNTHKIGDLHYNFIASIFACSPGQPKQWQLVILTYDWLTRLLVKKIMLWNQCYKASSAMYKSNHTIVFGNQWYYCCLIINLFYGIITLKYQTKLYSRVENSSGFSTRHKE